MFVWHTDRLHRSPVELEEFITACDPRGVPTHGVKAGALDLSTPSGWLVARQLGAVARYEVEHASEHIRGQKARASAAGVWLGGPRSFGYTPDGMALEPTEAEVIRDGVRRVLAVSRGTRSRDGGRARCRRCGAGAGRRRASRGC